MLGKRPEQECNVNTCNLWLTLWYQPINHPKISTIQRGTKVSIDFPVPQQLITNKTETITQRQVQDKNREQPFYPDPF